MATATVERPVEPGAPPPEVEQRHLPRWAIALGVIVLWVIIWSFTKGQQTLQLPGRTHTPLHESLTHWRDSILAGRDTNPVMRLTLGIADAFKSAVDVLQRWIAVAAFPRPVPEIGWLGVTALATWFAWAVANWRIALLVLVSFLSFGVFGYWEDAMNLLIVTGLSVAVAVLIGMPIAVLLGTTKWGRRILPTLLDLMQTMPSFVYLLPIVLFFGISVPGAVVCTLVYALPPIIKIAGFGIQEVSPTTIEATDSAGQNRWQRLVKVQLPMARPTIIVGLNQTILAALSMATIAAYIDGPGLGQPVFAGLVRNDFGGAFVPGLLIVVMAIMLDRATTAASVRSELANRGGMTDKGRRQRRLLLAAGLIPVIVCIVLSRQSLWAAQFPDTGWGKALGDASERGMLATVKLLGGATEAFKDLVTGWLLNPMQSLLADSPWWLSGAAIVGLAFALGGVRAILPTLVCLAGIRYFDLWHDAMITLNMTLVATFLVMIFAVALGVWMARSDRADLVIRPILDAGQTIPAFVYLIPCLALFGTSRFTAIVAGIVYAAPAAVKLVADGVRGVNPGTIEAGRSTGSTVWQEITKVQLPMAKGSILLATNQGLLYVLAMAVIGGMVGAGALGYDVVLGFSRSEEWGKGAAAGITIVMLGIMLDRIARAAAARQGAG